MGSSMPPGTRPGAIRSETYDAMLEYLEELSEKATESHTTALMRQQTNPSPEDGGGNDWKRKELSFMVRQRKVAFQSSLAEHFIELVLHSLIQ
ncbi:hypothetical protein UA08_06920 [Talaromyces atroroseus]|uniref:Uncharacterized protein n=1 Tax=Talaromyces atroroseus TaxID=1441469 RepID=A0A225ABP8_TALAT|nr:hypothetical protein UA08_06920 [Talaromyces atroroseus]OKL57740.1 hypothetical protein UA08_06920 [Talaromyces atroroseus]